MEVLWFILGLVFGGLAGGLFISSRLGKFLGRAMNAVVYFESKYNELQNEYGRYVATIRGGDGKLN